MTDDTSTLIVQFVLLAAILRVDREEILRAGPPADLAAYARARANGVTSERVRAVPRF
jgi:hypothetical protein